MYKKKFPNSIGIFHARYATHGEKTIDNCHPFYVGNDNLTVIAHNGILDIPTYDNRSDSRVFAEDLFPTYDNAGGIDNPVVFTAIEQWAKGSKIIVLTVNPKYKKRVYILNNKLGHYKEDIWWSNSGYKYDPYDYKYTTNYKNYYEDFYSKPVNPYEVYEDLLVDENGNIECVNCLQNNYENIAYDNDYVCERCIHCLICGDYFEDCKCARSMVGGDDDEPTANNNSTGESAWYVG
jgi:hypothetical protein